jgi:hypothetical protein
LEGDNLYKFLDPSKFPLEMVSEALQVWYEHQEKGKVAFRFKSFIKGKSIWEAPARKKVKVHTVGKGKKPVRSKQGKGQADTEWGSDESGSDDKPRLRKEAMEETESNDEVHYVKGKKVTRRDKGKAGLTPSLGQTTNLG